MAGFIQSAGAVIIAVVLGLALGNQRKELGILLTIAVCCMVLAGVITYLEPVISFLHHLETLSGTPGWLQTLLKAAGISLITEIASLVCADAGSSSLGKALQISGASVILWLSVPIFQSLISLIEQVLGEI